MRKFKIIIIIIALFVASSSLNITNSAMTNACRCEPNHKPQLTDGIVTPSEGYQTTLFTYSVNYSDADNDKPSFIYVIINCKFYRMQKQDPSDNDYTDGCIYTYSRYLEPGNYKYFFICSDGYRIAWTCRKCGPTVLCNKPPILCDGKVAPEVGEKSQDVFNFSVNYIDENNDAPEFLNITLDGTNHTMTKVDPCDCNYEDGCIYYYTTTLDEIGIHHFRFYTSDGYFWTFTETFDGPTVQDTIAPDLSCLSPLNITYPSGIIDINVSSSANDVETFWYTLYDITNEQWIGSQNGVIIIEEHATVELGTSFYLITIFVNDTAGNVNSTAIYFTVANPPILSEGQVTPSMGERWLTLFNFTVKYTDADNDPPTFLNITLDGKNYTMIKADLDDNNYIDGCLYYHTTTLLKLGTYQFNFYTSDGTYSTFTDIFNGPIVQDTTPPDIIINSPLNTTYNTDMIDINVSSDAIDLESFWYVIYSKFNCEWSEIQNGILIKDELTTVNLENNFYLITIFVNDTEGNVNSKSLYFTVSIPAVTDSTPPDIIVYSPLNTTYSTGTIIIDVSSTALDVDDFFYTLYDISNEQWIGDPNGILLENGYATIELENAFYLITVFVNDTKGNVNSKSLYFTVSIPAVTDPTSPDIIVYSPLNTTYSTGTIIIDVSSTALDVDDFFYTLYDISNEQWIGDPNGILLENGYATIELENAFYLITVFVNDTEGNVNSTFVYFTVAIDAMIITPPPEFWWIVGICSTIGAGAMVSVVVIKRRKSKAQKYHHDKIFKKQKGGILIFQDKLEKLEKDLEEKLVGLKAPPPPPRRDLNKKNLKDTVLPKELNSEISEKSVNQEIKKDELEE